MNATDAAPLKKLSANLLAEALGVDSDFAPLTVVALIDRLVQNSEVLSIEARESYRKKNSEENIKRRKDLNNDRPKKEAQ